MSHVCQQAPSDVSVLQVTLLVIYVSSRHSRLHHHRQLANANYISLKCMETQAPHRTQTYLRMLLRRQSGHKLYFIGTFICYTYLLPHYVASFSVSFSVWDCLEECIKPTLTPLSSLVNGDDACLTVHHGIFSMIFDV